MPAGQNVAGVNVDAMLMLFAVATACWLQQDRVLAVSQLERCDVAQVSSSSSSFLDLGGGYQ